MQAAARDSLGLAKLGGVAGFELRALLDQTVFLEQQVAAVEQQIDVLLATFEQHVTEIKGLGLVLAASLMAEIGDVSRFPRLESLVAYAGIGPSVFSSGEFTATVTHMSKRGSPNCDERFGCRPSRLAARTRIWPPPPPSARRGQAVRNGYGCHRPQAPQPDLRHLETQPPL